ncbi:hypothetical protein B0H13DRAFT_2661359 [Mycena leptocephala]|nr:hypothetical protein B0H13DRAFT_2661359 [Mycena leptocephala]
MSSSSIPYSPCDEHQIVLSLTDAVLQSKSLTDRFGYEPTASEVITSSTTPSSILELRGRSYLRLALRDICRSRLPPVARDYLVQAIVNTVETVLNTRQFQLRFSSILGSMATTGGDFGYDHVLCFLSKRLDDLLQCLRQRVVLFVDRVDVFIPPNDRLDKLLRRLRHFTDDQTHRPIRMADLSPVLVPNWKAPSKRSASDINSFIALAHANPDLRAFLQAVADSEVLSDGGFPCILPAQDAQAWWPVQASTMERQSAGAFGDHVMQTLISDILLDCQAYNGDTDVGLYEAVLRTATSDRTLLTLLFRMGVYQEIPDCPFDGMDALYPAVAFRVYFAIMHRSSPRYHKIVKTAAKNVFRILVDVLYDACQFFEKHRARLERSARHRPVLAEVQDGESSTPVAHDCGGSENTAPTVPQRRSGRTVVPTVISSNRNQSVRASTLAPVVAASPASSTVTPAPPILLSPNSAPLL